MEPFPWRTDERSAAEIDDLSIVAATDEARLLAGVEPLFGQVLHLLAVAVAVAIAVAGTGDAHGLRP
jgi:hypothetical protein